MYSGFILFMYVYRAFDTSDMTNTILKCNLVYGFELFLISFDTFDMVLYYIRTTLQDSMQHGLSTPPTYPGSCKSCFSRIPVFGGKISLIFPIIYQIAHLHNWPIRPLILQTAVLDATFTHFGGFFPIFTGQLALKFY